jgi:hypothetical protein
LLIKINELQKIFGVSVTNFQKTGFKIIELVLIKDNLFNNAALKKSMKQSSWPSRSAKVVLQLALDRLVRHYGYAAQVRGPAHAAIRTWLAVGAAFSVDGA